MAILIVDDAEEMRLLLGNLLEGAGYGDLLYAASAEGAFSHLGITASVACAPPAGIDLVLLDITMPGMDGIEACRRIRRFGSLSDLPIIIVTAHSDSHLLAEALEAGANDYITKPPNKVELLARVKAALRFGREVASRRAREVELAELATELEKVNERLKLLSETDGLTLLHNRRSFDGQMAKEWSHAARKRLPLALLMLDIDRFKIFNDTYGHQRGDDCLRDTAATIRETLHRPLDFAARYGGEEFAVLLPGTDARGAVTVAEAIRLAVERSIPAEGEPYPTVSIGAAAMTPVRGTAPELLIEAADRALYAAKRGGRNRVELGVVDEEALHG